MRDYFRTVARAALLCAAFTALLGAGHPAEARQRRRGRPARVKTAAPRVRFDAGQTAARVPFELLSNLVFLPVRVNGSRPLWFVLDAGATASVVDAGVAKELRLRTRGHTTASTSRQAVNVGLIPGVSLGLPGVEVSGLTVGSIPLDVFGPVVGRPVGGILGQDIIGRFVVELDYERRTLDLRAPAAYSYEGAGERLPLRFVGGNPVVEASVTAEGRAPVRGRFQLATASSGALLLNRPFVESHKLLQTLARTSLGNAGGVGGLTRTLVGRVRSLGLGRFDIAAPIVSFSQATEGEQASAATDGLIGGEVWRRFRLTLDYTHRQIILEPNASLNEPVEEDMSGLELVAEGPAFTTYVINEIIPDSPAAEAGLREEDELVEVDGRPAAQVGLEQIRQMFKQEGREHRLSLRRGGQPLQVTIKLRRLR